MSHVHVMLLGENVLSDLDICEILTIVGDNSRELRPVHFITITKPYLHYYVQKQKENLSYLIGVRTLL